MLRFAVIFFVFIIRYTIIQGQTKSFVRDPNSGSRPAEIFFEREIYDFGEIKEGTIAVYAFVFKNVGADTLKLEDVHPGCHCTVTEWTHKPIPPGDRGKIVASFDSKGRPGAFEKVVTVVSNGRSSPKVLYLKGTVMGKSPK